MPPKKKPRKTAATEGFIATKAENDTFKKPRKNQSIKTESNKKVGRPRGRPRKSPLTSNKSFLDASGVRVSFPMTSKTRARPHLLPIKMVDELLIANGVEKSEVKTISKCLKAAIQKGHFKLMDPKSDPRREFGLDQIFVRDFYCELCEATLQCTIRDVLFQPDFGCGDTQGSFAPVKCSSEDNCSGYYVTTMCEGQARFESGKFHHHCVYCRGLGKCLGDSTERHCLKCNNHFYAGSFGQFKCPSCYPNAKTMLTHEELVDFEGPV